MSGLRFGKRLLMHRPILIRQWRMAKARKCWGEWAQWKRSGGSRSSLPLKLRLRLALITCSQEGLSLGMVGNGASFNLFNCGTDSESVPLLQFPADLTGNIGKIFRNKYSLI